MMTLFDILKSAQGGNAFANLGQQYGLSPDAVQAAASALMPALASGFQGALQNPMAFTGLASQMLDPAHLASFTNPQSLSGGALQGGQTLLTTMFGNNEVVSQIIDHASQISGLQQQVMAQLFPAFASLIGGGLLQTLQTNGLNFGLSSGLSQFAGLAQSGNHTNDALTGVTNAMQSGWQAGLGAMMGALTGAAAGAASGATAGANPNANQSAAPNLAAMAQSFLGNFLGGGAAAPQPTPAAQPTPEATATADNPNDNPMSAAISSFASLLQPGVEVSAAHQDMLNQFMSMAANAMKK